MHPEPCVMLKSGRSAQSPGLRRLRGLLPLAHVQFWQAKNRWRLDSSHCGSHRRHLSCLVDASDVRAVNVLEGASEETMDGGGSDYFWLVSD